MMAKPHSNPRTASSYGFPHHPQHAGNLVHPSQPTGSTFSHSQDHAGHVVHHSQATTLMHHHQVTTQVRVGTSSTAPPRRHKPFPFVKLPPVIRVAVYKHVLFPKSGYKQRFITTWESADGFHEGCAPPGTPFAPGHGHAILRVDRQTTREALQILYASTMITFLFFGNGFQPHLNGHFRPAKLHFNYVRQLALNLDCCVLEEHRQAWVNQLGYLVRRLNEGSQNMEVKLKIEIGAGTMDWFPFDVFLGLRPGIRGFISHGGPKVHDGPLRCLVQATQGRLRVVRRQWAGMAVGMPPVVVDDGEEASQPDLDLMDW